MKASKLSIYLKINIEKDIDLKIICKNQQN